MISDITRMGSWSPVCKACWWDEGAGPQVGAWFSGRNEVPGRVWETRCQVVAADPGREFAWEVNNGWVHWGFRFEAVDGGTRLTEEWNLLPAGVAGLGEVFGARVEPEIALRAEMAKRGIPETLAAIKASAESGQ
jgi:hypothetical protein